MLHPTHLENHQDELEILYEVFAALERDRLLAYLFRAHSSTDVVENHCQIAETEYYPQDNCGLVYPDVVTLKIACNHHPISVTVLP